MRTLDQILDLLPELDRLTADELEDQDLDFKEWNTRSTDDAVKLLIEMAVCMANGGGGTIVFGVKDRAAGRSNAILGVPLEIDVNRLKRAVYDSTDPKITPVFEDLTVPEGTGRLLLMQIHPGLPPYTDTSGTGKVRIGKDCQPLTGSLRKRLMVETGETDVTAGTVPGDWQSHVSPVKESGESIIVTLLKQDVSAPFRGFVAEQAKQGRLPGVDELLILQYLLRHTELETTLAAELCQRPEAAMRNSLSRIERDYGWIQRGGTGRGTYWTLSPVLAKQLNPSGKAHSRIDWEAAKTRVLSVLMQRHQSAQQGLRNAEIRALTHFDRNQVFRLMRELQEENPQVSVTGHGVSARHAWNP